MKRFLLFRGLALILVPTVLLVSCKSGVDGERLSSEMTAHGSGHPLPHLDRSARFPSDGSAQPDSLATAFSPYTSQPYVVGAWYFTAWSRTNSFHATLSKSALNRYDPWGSIRDNFFNPSYPDYTPRKPLIGFYDGIDQRVMDVHIQQAASRGLSYFAFYWYWDTDRQEEAPISTPIHRFVASPHKSLMRFMIAPLRLGGKETSWSAWTKRMVPYIVHTYFADPAYLTTPDGRPIITDWDWGLSPAHHAAGIRFLRQYSQAHLGKNPLVLYLTELSIADGGVTKAIALGVDGFQCFSGISARYPGQPYYQMMKKWPIDGLVKNYFHLPCTSSGSDARAWCQIKPAACSPGGLYYPYAVDNTPPEFAHHLRVVKAYLDNTAATTLKMVTIYAWNEWGEGGNIEPGVAYGPAFLDTIQAVFGLMSRAPRPPAVDLEAAYPPPGAAVNPLEDTVQEAYTTLMDRRATASEVAAWSRRYEAKRMAKMDLVLGVYDSLEYQAKLPAAWEDFISFLYRQLFGRAPNLAELAYWSPYAAATGARRNVFINLLYSPEFEARKPILYPTYGAAPAVTSALSSPDLAPTLDHGAGLSP